MYRTILCAATALFIASQAEAQTPVQIFACVNNNSGTIHIVFPPNTACNAREISLNWNNVGPQGPPGNNGSQGPAGPQGPAGAQGPGGAQGPARPQGATGANGANGTNGTNGTALSAMNAQCEANPLSNGDLILLIPSDGDASVSFGTELASQAHHLLRLCYSLVFIK